MPINKPISAVVSWFQENRRKLQIKWRWGWSSNFCTTCISFFFLMFLSQARGCESVCLLVGCLECLLHCKQSGSFTALPQILPNQLTHMLLLVFPANIHMYASDLPFFSQKSFKIQKKMSIIFVESLPYCGQP